MFDRTKYTISKLSADFDVNSFSCSVEQLDKYLHRFALIHQDKKIGQTYILHEIESNVVLGYYTISTANVPLEHLPREYTVDFPRFKIPCVLIGKLAVDSKYQKNGFGKYLLFDALQRIKAISESVGCNAVIVDAIDDTAVAFYLKYGFIPYLIKSKSLFLPISTINAASN